MKKLATFLGMTCPRCNTNNGFLYVREVSEYHTVTALRGDTLIVGPEQAPYDQEMKERLFCEQCFTYFEVPPHVEVALTTEAE